MNHPRASGNPGVVQMPECERQTIPAHPGKATRLRRGEHIKIIDTQGSQVVDTWAFCDPDLGEFMSMEHSRSEVNSIFLRKNDTAITNMCRPILTMVDSPINGPDGKTADCHFEID
jgi:uncharacterized protein YcgI (DUF1989 family)